MIDSCTIEGTETQQWDTALRFPNQETMDALLFVFNQIGVKTETKIESPEKYLAEKKTTKKETKLELSRGLSLADSQIKFAVRLLSLYCGHSIPDTNV